MKKMMLFLCGIGVSLSAIAVEVIELPPPQLDTATTMMQAMIDRKTTRDFTPIPKKQLQQCIADLLWCANGQNRPGKRVIPAAIAKYAVRIYVADGNAVYRFDREKNTLIEISHGNHLGECASNAEMCGKSSFALIFSVDENVWGKERSTYAAMEIGAMMQNVYLGCAALKLGTCACGSFKNEPLTTALQLPTNEKISLVMLVGGAAK